MIPLQVEFLKPPVSSKIIGLVHWYLCGIFVLMLSIMPVNAQKTIEATSKTAIENSFEAINGKPVFKIGN